METGARSVEQTREKLTQATIAIAQVRDSIEAIAQSTAFQARSSVVVSDAIRRVVQLTNLKADLSVMPETTTTDFEDKIEDW